MFSCCQLMFSNLSFSVVVFFIFRTCPLFTIFNVILSASFCKCTCTCHLVQICCRIVSFVFSRQIKILMVVTHSQETCARNLYKSTCTRNLTVWHGFLYKIFLVQVSCTEYSTAIPYKKLACTWLEWWALIFRLPIATMFSFWRVDVVYNLL